MRHHVIRQYHAIPCNTMQYHASLITADGAYHCPAGSIWLFLNPTRRSSFANTVQPHWTQDLTPRPRRVNLYTRWSRVTVTLNFSEEPWNFKKCKKKWFIESLYRAVWVFLVCQKKILWQCRSPCSTYYDVGRLKIHVRETGAINIVSSWANKIFVGRKLVGSQQAAQLFLSSSDPQIVTGGNYRKDCGDIPQSTSSDNAMVY